MVEARLISAFHYIVMWSGLKANIPSGWALCDGNNGTPDLRNRFIVGAPDGEEAGGTGGASSLSHAGVTVGDHAAWTHNTQGAHTHDSHTTTNRGSGSNAAFTAPTTHASQGGHTHDQHPTQVHLVTQPAAHLDSRPPFYKLAFIMKL